MASFTRKVITYGGSLLLAGFLFYLAAHDIAFDELMATFREADYRWVLPLTIVVLASHYFRAWRWKMLTDALPEVRERAPVSVNAAFLSVLIGYFVNLLVPRLGEIVRAGNLARKEKLPFSGILGTVVVERTLDVFTLLIAIVSLAFIFSEQFVFMNEEILAPFLSQVPAWVYWTAAVGLISLPFAYRFVLNRGKKAAFLDRHPKIRRMLRSFRDGVFSLLHTPHPIGLIWTTFLMWTCYVLMAYFPLLMLGMTQTYDLGLVDAWSLMIFGTLGIIAPAPGGTGSYHYVTRLVLVGLYSIPASLALGYAVLAHGIHMVLYVIAGAIAFFLQGASLGELRQSEVESDTKG